MDSDLYLSKASQWLGGLRVALPAHAAIIDALAAAVALDEALRWLEVGCSLGAGRADVFSDVDAAIGYRGIDTTAALDAAGIGVAHRSGHVVDLLTHTLPGSPEGVRRFAAEFDSGVQLDLVVFPAEWRTGLMEGTVGVVDKDGLFVRPIVSTHAGPPTLDQAREWVMLGWWAVSDIAKFLQRGSLFEAAARIDAVREQALRLFAASGSIPYPEFGLTSLLDWPPFEVPGTLADTYCRPDDLTQVIAAAHAVVALHDMATHRAAAVLHFDLDTEWARTARGRLHQATTDDGTVSHIG